MDLVRLKGLKVLNGPPRGTAAMNSRQLLQLFSGLKADTDYESECVGTKYSSYNRGFS